MANKRAGWIVALGCAGLVIGIAARRGGAGQPAAHPRSRSTAPSGTPAPRTSPRWDSAAESSLHRKQAARPDGTLPARPKNGREILARVMNEGPSPHLLEELERTLHEAKEPSRWGMALWGLSRLDTPEAVQILARYVRTPIPVARRDEVVRHLGGMREPAAAQVLLDLASAGPTDPVAGAAVQAMVRRAQWDPAMRGSVEATLSQPMWQSHASRLRDRRYEGSSED